MKSFFLPILVLTLVCIHSVAVAQKKLVRVKRNADGTITELEEVDKRTIVRRTLKEKANKERIISSKSTYIMDGNRVLRNCKIADGQGNILFIIRYGYDKNTGRLIAEAMFDAKAQHFNKDGNPIPVQRLYYKYDPQGQRSKPFSITAVGDKKVEEFTSWKPHLKERMKTLLGDEFDEDAPTLLTPEQMKTLENQQP